MCHDLAGKTIKFVKDGETYTRTKCSYCISLKYPAVLSSPELQDSEGRWAFGIDTEFDIKRESGNITFSPKFSAGSGLIDEMLKRKIQIGEVEMAFGDYLLEKFAANCNDMDFEISGGSLTSDRVRIQDETQKYLDELREQDKLDYGRVDYYLDKGIDKKPLHISVFRSYTGETLEYKEAKKLCSGKSVAYIELAKK